MFRIQTEEIAMFAAKPFIIIDLMIEEQRQMRADLLFSLY